MKRGLVYRLVSVAVTCGIALCPVVATAEPTSIITEGVYVMGDGETPTFGEAMALQKAKQAALEQAGTYVESYTQIKHLEVTIDEIRTIAGGILKTEVLEKHRVLVNEGGERFTTKIRAVVTTDKIEELARRIKGGSAAGENREVLEKYARIQEMLQHLQLEMKQSRNEVEREVVLDKIRDVEKEFRQVRSVETALYKRILSGNELMAQANKALSDQYRRKEQERQRRELQSQSLKQVLDSLHGDGFHVEIDAPDVHVDLDNPDRVTLAFPVTLIVSERLKMLMKDLKKTYGGDIPSSAEEEIEDSLANVSVTIRVLMKNGREYTDGPLKVRFKGLRSYDIGLVLVNQAFNSLVSMPKHEIEHVGSVEGHVVVGGSKAH